jgi:hypothetical protein
VDVARLEVGYDPPRHVPECKLPVRVLVRDGDAARTIAAYGDYPLTVHRLPALLTRHLPWALSFYFSDVKVVRQPPAGKGHLLFRARIHSLGTTKRVIGTGASWGVTSRKYRAALSWKVTARWVGSGLRPFLHDQRVYGTVDAFRFGASGDIVRSALRQALQELLADLLGHPLYARACGDDPRRLPIGLRSPAPRSGTDLRAAPRRPPAVPDAKTPRRPARTDAKTPRRPPPTDAKTPRRPARTDAKTPRRPARTDAKTPRRPAVPDPKSRLRPMPR